MCVCVCVYLAKYHGDIKRYHCNICIIKERFFFKYVGIKGPFIYLKQK